MPSSRVARRLRDIIDNIDAITGYVEGIDAETFEQDRRTYDAVERCLERISEAAAKLGDMAVHLMPDQPWNEIRGLGNILRHEYDRVQPTRLFDIVINALPSLRAAAHRALMSWRGPEEKR